MLFSLPHDAIVAHEVDQKVLRIKNTCALVSCLDSPKVVGKKFQKYSPNVGCKMVIYYDTVDG